MIGRSRKLPVPSAVAVVAVVAAAAFSCVTGTAVVAQQPPMPPAKVEVAVAELRQMAPMVEIPGTVVSLNDSSIAAEVDGVLTWLANVGDAVARNDVLARIDPRLMKVAVRRATANVARLEADHRYREQQLARAEDLAASNNAAANFLDESRALRDQALHQLTDARAQLERAEGDLERTEIRAAFAGHVAARLAAVGEYVAVGEDVVRLVDTHRTEISLPAPIALATLLAPGLQVTVRNGAAERQYAVRAIVPVGDAKSRMVEVRLSAADSDWLVGTPVQVSLPRDIATTTVAVPRDALVERSGESYLYRVRADGTAEKVVARIQSTVGLWAGIAGGVEPGDRVVIRGGERLAPGQSVEVIEGAGAR